MIENESSNNNGSRNGIHHALPDESHFMIGVHLEGIDAVADAVRALDERGDYSNGSGLSKNTLSSLMIQISDHVRDVDRLIEGLQTQA